jgi:predicted O-methyltransferase YrrM
VNRFVVHPPADVGPLGHSPVVVGPTALAACARAPSTLRRCLELQRVLAHDPFTHHVASMYERGLDVAGDRWGYMDVLSVLHAAASLGRPRTYLEVGVRRGRSTVCVADAAPEVEILGFDLWMEGYGGNANPGPEWVREELRKVGHRGPVRFVSGDSHTTLPAFFRERPEIALDLVTIDGDHSPRGARADLDDVAPRIPVGGVLVFDDIVNAHTPGLLEVWRAFVEADGGLASHEYAEIGCGVAFAVRMAPGRLPRRRGARWRRRS